MNAQDRTLPNVTSCSRMLRKMFLRTTGAPGKCLAQLVSRPFGSRMRCDPEVNDSPALVSQNEKHVQNLKPDGRDREEVYRYQTLTMILKKSSPRLRDRKSVV